MQQGDRRQSGPVRMAHRHGLGNKLPKNNMAAGKENKRNGQGNAVNGNLTAQPQGNKEGSRQLRHEKRAQKSQRQRRKGNARLAGGQIQVKVLDRLRCPGQLPTGTRRNAIPGVQLAFANLHQGELGRHKKRVQQ